MRIQEALAILKPERNNEKGLKDAYRAACKKYHPDLGGDLEMMKLVNLAFDTLNQMDSWWSAAEARQAARQTPLTEALQRVWDAIKHLPGLKAELIGTWLWVTGTTYNYRDVLKAAGMKYSKPKNAWYYHADDYRKRGDKMFSLDDIRVRFGFEDVMAVEKTAIAQ